MPARCRSRIQRPSRRGRACTQQSLNLASLRGGGGLGGLSGLIGSVFMWLATGTDQGGQQQVEGGLRRARSDHLKRADVPSDLRRDLRRRESGPKEASQRGGAAQGSAFVRPNPRLARWWGEDFDIKSLKTQQPDSSLSGSPGVESVRMPRKASRACRGIQFIGISTGPAVLGID
jgi:hypothetical protein